VVHSDDPRQPTDQRPPFGGSWRRLYLLVALNLALLIVLFWAFTRAFR